MGTGSVGHLSNKLENLAQDELKEWGTKTQLRCKKCWESHANADLIPLMAQQDARERKRRALYVKAQQAAERSVVIRERTLGSNHPTLAGAYTNLGKIYMLRNSAAQILSRSASGK